MMFFLYYKKREPLMSHEFLVSLLEFPASQTGLVAPYSPQALIRIVPTLHLLLY